LSAAKALCYNGKALSWIFMQGRRMLRVTLRTGSFLAQPRWLALALLGVFGLILVQYLLKVTHSEHGNRSAFLRWRAQLEDLDDGINVWDRHAYPNPPIMAIVLRPFMQLPPLVGSALWFTCKALMAVAAILGVVSLLDAPDRPFPPWGKLLAVILSLRPIAGDLVHGNVNLLILFLVVAVLVAFHQRRDTLAGLLLGLSIACKLTPALFIGYFLWKRAWKTLLGTAAGILVFGLLIPALVFSWSKNLEYLQSWHQQMVAPYAAGIVSSEHKNQSLPGLLHRMLCDEASFSDYDGDRKIVLETHNLAALDRPMVQAIVISCMAIFALLAVRWCRPSCEDRGPLRLMAEFSVVVLGMLLFCERTWKHHCVTLLLPFAALAYCVSAGSMLPRMRWYLATSHGLVALLMLSTSTGAFDHHLDAHDRLGKLAQVYGAYVWAFLILLANLFTILADRTFTDYDARQTQGTTPHVN
jgi:alpha-1,2-mannosyltransferase